jgi:hypothetical protein
MYFLLPVKLAAREHLNFSDLAINNKTCKTVSPVKLAYSHPKNWQYTQTKHKQAVAPWQQQLASNCDRIVDVSYYNAMLLLQPT